MATSQDVVDAVLADVSKTDKTPRLFRLFASVNEMASLLRNPSKLIPTIGDLRETFNKAIPDETERRETMEALDRLVADGVLVGSEWTAMIMAMRRWEDRDAITQRVAPHAGLHKLIYYDATDVEQTFVYMAVLIIVEKTDKKSKQILMPKGPNGHIVAVREIYKKGIKLPVWRATPTEAVMEPDPVTGEEKLVVKQVELKGKDLHINYLPAYDVAPRVQVRMAYEDALDSGIETTCIVYLPWETMIRVASVLKFDKGTKEGMADTIQNRTIEMKDIVTLVPSIGPALGGFSAVEITYRRIAMQMVNCMSLGKAVATFKEIRDMCDPEHSFFVFRSARTYRVGGRRIRFIRVGPCRQDPSRSRWLLVSPVRHPYKVGKGPNKVPRYRTMMLDPERGFLGLLVEFIWFMAWSDQTLQKDFDAIRAYKQDVIDGLKCVVSKISDRRIIRAMREPGQNAESAAKIVDKFYDSDGPHKAWDPKPALKVVRKQRLLSFCSRWKAQELSLDAENNILTIVVVDKLATAENWFWDFLPPERKREMVVPLHRLAYEVVERTKVLGAEDRETFNRSSATSLIGDGLYRQLSQPEKDKKVGELLARGDKGDLGTYQDVTLPNDARMAKTYPLIEKGVGRYPTSWMPTHVQDHIRNIVMFIGYFDIAVIDSWLGPLAKSYGMAVDRDDAKLVFDQQFTMGRLTGGGLGIRELARLRAIDVEIAISPDGVNKKAIVERMWRIYDYAVYALLDEIYRRYGVEMGLAERWLRVMRIDGATVAAEVEEEIRHYSEEQERTGKVDEGDYVLAESLRRKKVDEIIGGV